MTKFKIQILLFFIFPAFFIIGAMLFDPYGIFLRREPTIFGLGMRIMAANAINSGKFDSYIMGTSIAENSSAREIEELLGDGRFANISMSASTFYERSLVLRHLFSKGEAKHIIYSLESESYFNQSMEQPAYPAKNFIYLYEGSRLTNLKIYFNITAVKSVRRQWPVRRSFTRGRYKDYDMPYNWSGIRVNSQRYGGLEKWFAAKNHHQIKEAFADISKSAKRGNSTRLKETAFTEAELATIEKAKAYCDEYVIKFVKEHPSTEFYLFFPPYSRIRFATWYQDDKSAALVHQGVVRYFVEMAAQYKNLHIFGFEDQPFLDDISLYRDTLHYHEAINSLINRSIASGKNMLTEENVDSYLDSCEELALNFDLKSLAARIDDYLNSDGGV